MVSINSFHFDRKASEILKTPQSTHYPFATRFWIVQRKTHVETQHNEPSLNTKMNRWLKKQLQNNAKEEIDAYFNDCICCQSKSVIRFVSDIFLLSSSYPSSSFLCRWTSCGVFSDVYSYEQICTEKVLHVLHIHTTIVFEWLVRVRARALHLWISSFIEVQTSTTDFA